MQSNDSAFSGWHATDDESPVPIRSNEQSLPPEKVQKNVGMDIRHEDEHPHHVIVSRMQSVEASRRGMTLSAVLGVCLAIVGIGAYLGIGDLQLRGDLLGEVPSEGSTEITITAEGTFSPDSVTLKPGQQLVLKNENIDPQVLKPRSNPELFPVQVVFDQPYAFTVPENVSGEFVYYSETLPEDRTLTIIVPRLDSQTVNPETSLPPAVTENQSAAIPLPFGGGSVEVPMQEALPPTIPTPAVTTAHEGDSATISLGGNAQGNTESSFEESAIPTNPYTVASAPRSVEVMETLSESGELRSGAPLLAQSIRTPQRTPDSGPAGFLLFFVPAMLGVCFLSKKLTTVA